MHRHGIQGTRVQTVPPRHQMCDPNFWYTPGGEKGAEIPNNRLLLRCPFWGRQLALILAHIMK
jgi:hypothetical protein